MKKRTFLAITATVVFVATITYCGADSAESKEVTDAIAEVEEVIEETVIEDAAASVNGEELFASSGCVACHQLETKTVGPSIKEIKEAYNENAEGLNAFLSGEGEPIVDVAMAAVMAPQIEVTKEMSPEDRGSFS